MLAKLDQTAAKLAALFIASKVLPTRIIAIDWLANDKIAAIAA